MEPGVPHCPVTHSHGLMLPLSAVPTLEASRGRRAVPSQASRARGRAGSAWTRGAGTGRPQTPLPAHSRCRRGELQQLLPQTRSLVTFALR